MNKQKIRDELIKIRTLLDHDPTKAKQQLTNLIKELLVIIENDMIEEKKEQELWRQKIRSIG